MKTLISSSVSSHFMGNVYLNQDDQDFSSAGAKVHQGTKNRLRSFQLFNEPSNIFFSTLYTYALMGEGS